MSFSELASTIVNLKHVIESDLDRGRGVGSLRLSLGLSDSHRRLACGVLLMDLDISAFRRHLLRGAELYRDALQRPSAGSGDDYYRTCSFATPMFDALVARSSVLAANIASLMPRDRRSEQGELADQFSYFRLVGDLVAGVTLDPSAFEPALRRFGEALDGERSARFDACAAIVARDPEVLDAALLARLGEWRAAVDEAREADRIHPYDVHTVAHVCIEVAGLVLLAALRGVATRHEYDGVPDLLLA